MDLSYETMHRRGIGTRKYPHPIKTSFSQRAPVTDRSFNYSVPNTYIVVPSAARKNIPPIYPTQERVNQF